MTLPAVQNLKIQRGDDVIKVITFSSTVSGFADIRFVIRPDWATTETDDEAALFVAIVGDGIELTGTYTATVTIPYAITATLTNSAYAYDIAIVNALGNKRTTQIGKLRMSPDVSRG
jgi:hypothetical protein